MFEIAEFIFSKIIEFINSLRLIVIPNTNITLLGFYLSILTISIIMTFIRRFFKIEQNIFNRNLNNQYKINRQKLIKQASINNQNRKHSTKYLQKNSRRYN